MPSQSSDMPGQTPRVLVAYSMPNTCVQTTNDYLNAFSRYLDAEVDYIHVTDGAEIGADLERYDAVINNYCVRHVFQGNVARSFVESLRSFQGAKILIVQDEYDGTNILKKTIRDLGFDLVLTCVPQDSLEYVYPRDEFPHVRFETVLTGYVPDHLMGQSIQLLPISERPVVVGYRGGYLTSRYGRLAFEKYEIGNRVREFCRAGAIPHDIEMDAKSRIYGDAWFTFVGSCRAMLGSESGSNVFDFDGTIAGDYELMKVNLRRPPTYEEFASRIAQREREISMGQISPRVFECAAARTPMILFRGRYSDLITPDVHYIPLEKDFSNIDAVFDRLRDVGELEALAERAYQHLVASGAYGYRAYMRHLGTLIGDVIGSKVSRRSPPISSSIDISPSHLPRADIDESRIEWPSSAPGSAASWYENKVKSQILVSIRVIEDHLSCCAYIEKDIQAISARFEDSGPVIGLLRRVEVFRASVRAFEAKIQEWSGKTRPMRAEPPIAPTDSVDRLVKLFGAQLNEMSCEYDRMISVRDSLIETLRQLEKTAPSLVSRVRFFGSAVLGRWSAR